MNVKKYLVLSGNNHLTDLPSLLNADSRYNLVKRITDIFLSFFGLIFFIPFVLIYSIFILAFYRVNPFYVQKRYLGKKESDSITVCKLRTIRLGSAVQILDDRALNRTIANNSFLPLGKFLRRSGIDESPQLLLVLIGKMSIIGPRPLSLEDIINIEKQSENWIAIRDSLKSKPGISGLWQLERSSLEFEELVNLDSQYEATKSIGYDLKLISQTLSKIIKRSHLDCIS